MIKNSVGSIMRFVRYLVPYKWLWLAGFIFSGIYALLALLMPCLVKIAVDTGLGRKDAKSFILFGILASAVFVAGELFEMFRRYVTQKLRNRVSFDIRRDALDHLYGLGTLYFKDCTAGELLYKFEYDIEVITELITSSLPQVFSMVPRLIIIFAIICFIDARLAAFCLVFIALTLILPVRLNARMRKRWEDTVVRSEEAFKHLEEAFSRILLIKAFGKERAALRDHLKRFGAAMAARIRSLWLELIRAFTGSVLAKALAGLVALFGGYQVLRGRLSLGGLAAVMAYLYQLGSVEQELFGCLHTAAIGSVSCRRLGDLLDERPTVVDIPAAADAHFAKGEVIFERVTFGYREDRNILQGATVRIAGGSHVALVGPSGCGKTTLASLIARLFDPREGRVTIDGYDIKTVTLHSLKRQIGFALQEPYLWNDTVRNNIAYGMEEVRPDEVERAAEAATVGEFAARLKQGYDTVIGENACKLSEGQKQKIAIARALAKKPRILILDEALSSIDSAGEERMLHNIKERYPGMTLIIISHRLSTVMAADSIVYFDKGGHLAEGTARELAKRYASLDELFKNQGERALHGKAAVL